MEKWNSTGCHQICCLACGHLFGKKCIERWLKTKKSCPKCLKKAYTNHIRLLYVDNISVVDISEKDQLKQQLEKERQLRIEAETKLMKLQMKNKLQVENKFENHQKFIFKEMITTMVL